MIKFFNIRTGETRLADTEPKIAALLSSSDLGPNISQGQDFGWRLAPEIIDQLKVIKNDPATITRIAVDAKVMTDDVTDAIILEFISKQYNEVDAPVADQKDYEDEYNNRIREIEKARRAQDDAADRRFAQHNPDSEIIDQTTTTTTTEAPTTTTTTTAAPTTTTTTTVKK